MRSTSAGSRATRPGPLDALRRRRFGREHSDMVIMHFDLIRLRHDYCWLQGIGASGRSGNDESGSGAGVTLDHAMTVEELPVGDEAAQSAYAT